MNFIKKLFVRRPEDYISKGDALFAAGSFFEARCAFEEGLQGCREKAGYDDLIQQIGNKIDAANLSLAHLNIDEAEHAFKRGAVDKAVEHLELAKTLTHDANIREKAESMLASVAEKSNDTEILAPVSSCSSCSTCSPDSHATLDETVVELDPHEHYDLLIHQLPEDMYGRYAVLGEDFAYSFIAASHDRHEEALELLEKWFDGSERDIYFYEKGKIFHRLGRISESETYMLESIKANPDNSLAQLGLALLFIEEKRFEDAGRQIDIMIEGNIFVGQALMMRGEVFELSGDVDGAIRLYGSLLETPLARSAAEKLHKILLACNRQTEAAHVFKRYLGKCNH